MLQMSTIKPADVLIESALKVWKLNEIRFARVFHALSEVELQREIAPERNRLIYIWGHVVAVNDGLFPLLGIGPRLYPELENTFLLQPDRTVPDIYSGDQMKRASTRVADALWEAFTRWTASEWLALHTGVTAEEFSVNPTRNRFTVMVNRTAHVAYHLGQAVLATKQRE
jgi:hypothetical protein